MTRRLQRASKPRRQRLPTLPRREAPQPQALPARPALRQRRRRSQPPGPQEAARNLAANPNISAAVAAYRTGDIAAASGRSPGPAPAGEVVPAVQAVTRVHGALPVQTGEQTNRPLVPPPTSAAPPATTTAPAAPANAASTGQSGTPPRR
ncbi:hypothetical protein ACHMW6_28780 [Pseudoduganella sp. UC29_106]|uniref:hypothetical protein n=1 Tax=Pseudoduganella sp. UC29_106 TaxID=3374553 RepID=UPI0037566FAD